MRKAVIVSGLDHEVVRDLRDSVTVGDPEILQLLTLNTSPLPPTTTTTTTT